MKMARKKIRMVVKLHTRDRYQRRLRPIFALPLGILFRQQSDGGPDAVVVVDVLPELEVVAGEELDPLGLQPVDALPVDEGAVGAAEVAHEAPAPLGPQRGVAAREDAAVENPVVRRLNTV